MPHTSLFFPAIVAATLLHWLTRRGAAAVRRRALRRLAGEQPPRSTYLLEILLSLVALGGWATAAWLILGDSPYLAFLRDMTVDSARQTLTASSVVIGERSYSLLDLLQLPAVLGLVWLFVAATTRLLRTRLKRLARVQPVVQDTLLAFVRYAFLIVGGLLVLHLWGLDVSSLAIFASVLGVGIGFGLQNLASNFVSGLVIGFERPVQPGDFVQVGEWIGTVERIGPRCTEITTLDRVSILVPNSRFLDGEVVNWSHGDPVYRLHVPVGVAYGSDVARVRAALLSAAVGHRAVLADPRTRVEFKGFGDSALLFELQVWARDPRLQHRLLSDLNFRVEASLRRNGIQIPFPQRDLHLRSPQIEEALRAWTKRTFSADELAAVRADASNGKSSEPMSFFDDAAPRSWSTEELNALASKMHGTDGLAIADRRHVLRTYPRSFVGREAVDWMVRELALSRDEAVDLGRLLVTRGVIHHVLDEHGFEDDNFFYRFRCDEAAQNNLNHRGTEGTEKNPDGYFQSHDA